MKTCQFKNYLKFDRDPDKHTLNRRGSYDPALGLPMMIPVLYKLLNIQLGTEEFLHIKALMGNLVHMNESLVHKEKLGP